MHLHIIVPTDDENLQGLKWFFLGLRQQTLDPENWSVWIAHRGRADLLEQSLSAWRHGFGSQILLDTLILPSQTTPGALLNLVLKRVSDTRITPSVILVLQPGFQPHRYLLEHHQRYHQRNPNSIALGSNQYEPEQALTFWGMSSQLEQLCFSFFPTPYTQVLPYTSFHLHNMSLPSHLMLPLDESFGSWRFCAWDLSLRWWVQNQRIQPHHDLRCCLMSQASFETMTQQWQQDCQQDLVSYFQKHPFPLPVWELEGSSQPVPDTAQLLDGLKQSQSQPCVFLESETSIEKALLQWRQQLRQLWRNLALQVLSQDSKSFATQAKGAAICPYPWRQLYQPSLVAPRVENLLWGDWFQCDWLACQSLLRHFQGACIGIAQDSRLFESFTMPWYEFNQVQTHFQRSSEIKAALVMDAPFAELLKVFLYLNECLAPNSLLVLAPLKSKNIQDLHRMILSHYAWIELDYLAQTVILCRVAAA